LGGAYPYLKPARIKGTVTLDARIYLLYSAAVITVKHNYSCFSPSGPEFFFMLTRALRAKKTLKEEKEGEGDRLTYFLILFPTVRHPNLRGEPCAALTGASTRVCSYRCLTEVSKHNIFFFLNQNLPEL